MTYTPDERAAVEVRKDCLPELAYCYLTMKHLADEGLVDPDAERDLVRPLLSVLKRKVEVGDGQEG